MASTNFTSGTVVASTWLNDVDIKTYEDVINVKMSPYNAVGDGVTDDTAALQAAITAAASSAQYGGRAVYIPGGNYKTSADLVIPEQYITIYGDGMYQSRITCSTNSTNGLTASVQYLRPNLRDFSVVCSGTSSKAIKFDTCGTVYNGSFINLYAESTDTAFEMSGAANAWSAQGCIFFSCHVQNVVAKSSGGHVFHANCGPAVTWISCYGLSAGSGKALYRLAGNINMSNCNGGNDPGFDYWGVFGNNLASADGFQSDFVVDDYPDINLEGCNVEYFGSLTTAGEGIRVQNAYRNFNFIGGKIDRAGLATNYSALVRFKAGANGGVSPAVFAPSWILLGGGTASLADFYSDSVYMVIYDTTGQMAVNGFTTYKVGANTYPMLKQTVDTDVYLGSAMMINAISPRRLSMQMLRYKVPAALTPVGSNQAIDVTGYTKVIVTPAASASVSTATFTATAGADLDYGRNGDLLIEAGNGNLTLVHSASGTDTFKMASGSNLVMTSGQIARFCRSETTNNWIQV